MKDDRAKSLTELASKIGVSRTAVIEWRKRDDWKFSRSDTPADGWDVQAVREWRAATLAPVSGGKPAESGELDAELGGMDPEKAARIRLLIARASSVEFDRQVKGGRYLRREDVERRSIAKIHAVRSRLQALPRQVAGELAGLDEYAIEAELRSHCDAICFAFADGAEISWDEYLRSVILECRESGAIVGDDTKAALAGLLA